MLTHHALPGVKCMVHLDMVNRMLSEPLSPKRQSQNALWKHCEDKCPQSGML